jgi:putative ABC transport system substrate-binding protein
MRRRAILGIVASSASWSQVGLAQPASVPVVGWLESAGLDDHTRRKVSAFREGLVQAGFASDNDAMLEIASGEGRYDRLPDIAEKLVKRPVAVILAASLPSLLAAKDRTSTIPIVFVIGADPVALKLVDSLGRPGGNVTGVSQYFGALGGKRLEILRDLVPGATTIAILSDPRNANASMHLGELERAARALGQKTEVFTARDKGELESADAQMAERRMAALVVADDALFTQERAQLVALAARYSLPAIYYASEFTEAGGLIAYGSRATDNFRLAGAYVGRILKGARPADLPVLQPTRFDLIVNLKVARTLGLSVPPSLLARADKVIE